MSTFAERYKEYMDNVDPVAYHAGESHWHEGDYDVYRSYPWSPPGCHESCGCIFYLKEGKLEKVEGDPLSPFTNGKLCMRCLDMAEATNHPDRLKYPMKRVGERGSGEWERISWDEAVDLVAEKMKYYRETYGPQSIWVASGTGRDAFWGTGLMAFVAAETPNQDIVFNIGHSCYVPRLLASKRVWGDWWECDTSFTHEQRYMHPEWVPSKTLIVWGCAPLMSNPDGYIGHWLISYVQDGCKIISVDPRLTWWSARADYFLQLRPGTDAALAMAMINVIITDGIYDKDFVEKWCYGFDELAEAVRDMTPERAAEICDLDAEDIRGAARLFATEGPGTVRWGVALEQQPNAMLNNLAILDLIAICGYVDCPGGAILIREAFNQPRNPTGDYCPEEYRNLSPQKVTPNDPLGDTTNSLRTWEGDGNDRARMMIFFSCNSLGNTAGYVERVYDALKTMEFVVGIDPFMNPTLSALADVVLPVAMTTETDSMRAGCTPLRPIARITEYEETLDDVSIALKFVHALHGDGKLAGVYDSKDMCNWRLAGGDESKIVSAPDAADEDAEEAYDWRAAVKATTSDALPEGFTHDDLIQANYLYDGFCDTYYKYEKGMLRADGLPGFNTTTGMLELYSLAYEQWGMSPVPIWIEPDISPVSTPELFEKYPLIMDNGVVTWEFFKSEHKNLETMREFHPWPLVCMNQSVADRFGIEEGQWTWIENDRGRFKQVAHIVPNLKDYVITTEAGWWFPEEDAAAPTLYRTFDSNPNLCVDVEREGYFGCGDYKKMTPVTIYPVKEGDITPTEQIMLHGGFPQQRERRKQLGREAQA